MKEILVIFIGSNPSNSAFSNVPFCESTKSGKTLRDWIWKLEISMQVERYNLANKPTPRNRPLNIAEIKKALPALENHIEFMHYKSKCNIKLVAVGKTAHKALTLLRLPHFEMPHPSPVNRQLNDKEFIKSKLNKLSQYIQT